MIGARALVNFAGHVAHGKTGRIVEVFNAEIGGMNLGELCVINFGDFEVALPRDRFRVLMDDQSDLFARPAA